MLSNCEFAVVTNTKIDLPKEFAEFAMFTLLMDETIIDGKPAFPRLAKKFNHTPLWRVGNRPNKNRHNWANAQKSHDGIDVLTPEEEKDRQEKLAAYIKAGKPFGGNFDMPTAY